MTSRASLLGTSASRNPCRSFGVTTWAMARRIDVQLIGRAGGEPLLDGLKEPLERDRVFWHLKNPRQ